MDVPQILNQISSCYHQAPSVHIEITSFLETTANVSFLCSILKYTADIISSNLQQVQI